MIIKNEKVSFKRAYKEASRYFLSIIGIKLILLGIYLIPLVVFLTIGLAYKPLFILMIFLLIIVWLIFKFVFLFVYAVLFLRTNKGSLKTVKETINYFNSNKKNVFLTGLFVLVVGLVVSLILSLFPNAWSNIASQEGILWATPLVVVIFTIIKYLVSITVMLWSTLFIFKMYHL